MPQGSKLVVTLAHPYILAHHLPFSPYLLPCAWKKERGMKKGESEKKRNRKGIPGSRKCYPPFFLEPWQSKTGLLPPLH
jgi:hypothetical protein